MALTDLRFQPSSLAADLHVVRGIPSAPFSQTLKIEDTSPAPASTVQLFDWEQPPGHVEVQTVAHFAPSGTQAPGVRRGHGVSVDLSMRAQRNADGDELIPFCPVCRYVLVDLIDPTKHGIIDRDYAAIYPDPRL